jgi:CRISPR-associated protein Csd1
MSWMERLYETYQAGILLDLPIEEGKQPLMPTSHTVQNAHINIVIDGEGNFKSAEVLEKTQIILPATESSASRSSGEAPHPLADKLQYVAKDYPAYGGLKKAYFDGYQSQLRAWCESEYAHDKVKAVLRYVEKGTVIADLIGQKIVWLDENNILLTQWDSANGEPPKLFKVLPKEKGKLDQGSALVCWTVWQAQDRIAETWKDPSIQASWIAYDTAGSSDTGLCYITGQEQSLASNHPAKVRHSGDKAKLISSNDNSGYTYRGKFLEAAQACGIGFDVSQKAHNALRWLISRQSFRNGDQVYVSWAVSGKAVPEALFDSFGLFQNAEANLDDIDDNLATAATQTVINQDIDLGQSYAKKLSQYMAGYAAKLDPNEPIIIMGIDSATPGRMGIIYYRELMSREFLERLESWHSEFAWHQRHSKEIDNKTGKKPKTITIFPISSPVPRDIATAAYGENVTDNLKKKVIERLVPCIIDKQDFPADLVNNCVRNVSNRIAYASDKQWLWEKNLGITCALYKGFRARHPDSNQRRNFDMTLEENHYSRDYLYGRLLAIADSIESYVLSEKMLDEKRPTNATRYMQRFSKNPLNTWLIIHNALMPYIERLQSSEKNKPFIIKRLKRLEDVHHAFLTSGGFDDAPLTGEFLLGYYCERKALNAKKDKTDDTTSTGDTE